MADTAQDSTQDREQDGAGRDPVRETVATEPQRWIHFEGLDNVRDVGGLPLRDGGSTRPGVLLRSANLRAATPSDVRRLVEDLGLRLVIDLRTAREVDRDGPTAVAAAGVETVALTFLPDDGLAFPVADGTTDVDPLLSAYLGYLDDRPDNVVAAVALLAGREDAAAVAVTDADPGATLVHCAAGKDRTGVLVALVLDAVGVEREAVVADYALSAEQVEAMWRRWTTAAGTEMPDDLTPHLPRAEVMAALLARLDAEHGDGDGGGGAAGWLRAHGLPDDALARLRRQLTGR